MSVDAGTLRDELAAEFYCAVMNRHRARHKLSQRDSPENRAAADAADHEIDAVLDIWLESKGDCE